MKTMSYLSRDFYQPLAIVLLVLLLFCVHFLWGSERFFKRRIFPRLKGQDSIKTQAMEVLYKRLTAFLLYGVCTYFIVRSLFRESIRHFGLSRGQGRLPLSFLAPVLVLSFLTLLYFSRKEKIYRRYPEMSAARTSVFYFTLSAVTYALYLFSYELLFRGFLLFGLKRSFGSFPAALISMGFVTLTHIGTSVPVILGSMVSGIIFPYMALLSGSIWPVFFLHAGIGVGMDYLCVRYQLKTGSAPPFTLTDRHGA
jgi:membrane protease YdiL (CAAX protease family)